MDENPAGTLGIMVKCHLTLFHPSLSLDSALLCFTAHIHLKLIGPTVEQCTDSCCCLFVFCCFSPSQFAVGGGEDLRRYWSDYLRRTHVLVYVVDSSDRSRFPLAKAELHRLLRAEPQLPVVVLGNKQVRTSFLLTNNGEWVSNILMLVSERYLYCHNIEHQYILFTELDFIF